MLVVDFFLKQIIAISHGMARVLGDGNVHEMDFNSDTNVM